MPGTGKSTLIAELAARGYRAVDADEDGLSHIVTTTPVVTDPGVTTDPVVTVPVVKDPVVTNPIVTNPVVADPVVTDPVVTDSDSKDTVAAQATETADTKTVPQENRSKVAPSVRVLGATVSKAAPRGVVARPATAPTKDRRRLLSLRNDEDERPYPRIVHGRGARHHYPTVAWA